MMSEKRIGGPSQQGLQQRCPHAASLGHHHHHQSRFHLNSQDILSSGLFSRVVVIVVICVCGSTTPQSSWKCIQISSGDVSSSPVSILQHSPALHQPLKNTQTEQLIEPAVVT